MEHKIKIEILDGDVASCDIVICLMDGMIYEIEEVNNGSVVAVEANGRVVKTGGTASFRKIRFIPEGGASLFKKLGK